MFEGVHDEDGEAQSENVGQETGVEVGSAVLLEATGDGQISGCQEAGGDAVDKRGQDGVT